MTFETISNLTDKSKAMVMHVDTKCRTRFSKKKTKSLQLIERFWKFHYLFQFYKMLINAQFQIALNQSWGLTLILY